MTEHYVRYASLAANLQPPLTEYDLVTALTSYLSMEIQRAMLAANLRSSQEALAFLGRMQSLVNSQEVYKKSKQEQFQKISRGNCRKVEIREEVVVTARCWAYEVHRQSNPV